MFNIPACEDGIPTSNLIVAKRNKRIYCNNRDESSKNIVFHNASENIFKRQKNNDNATIKKKSEEYLNFDILNAADEVLMNEKKKQLDDEIRNVDQEDLLFSEINEEYSSEDKGTVIKRKAKHKKRKKLPIDASPSVKLKNEFSPTENIVQGCSKHNKNIKTQKENVNYPAKFEAKMVSKRTTFKKIDNARNQKNSKTMLVNRIRKDRELHLDVNKNSFLSTNKLLKQEDNSNLSISLVNRTQKEKNKNININTSPETNSNIVLLKKVPNNFKTEKLKEVVQNNRRSIHISGLELRKRMLERLKAAQFRHLNEKLYTSSATIAQQLFQSDPSAFHTYHQGYRQQLKKWPINPLDIIVQKILKMPESYIIADMGCGEAALSKRVPHTVHSFDLVSTAPGVQACDMAHTPLEDGAVHACVYCLALMGTQLTQYLLEANRVLKPGGQLLIAEVESRFTDVESFTRDVQRLGFKLRSLDKSHRVFFFLHFQKTGAPPVKKVKLPELTLNPCLYKKR